MGYGIDILAGKTMPDETDYLEPKTVAADAQVCAERDDCISDAEYRQFVRNYPLLINRAKLILVARLKASNPVYIGCVIYRLEFAEDGCIVSYSEMTRIDGSTGGQLEMRIPAEVLLNPLDESVKNPPRPNYPGYGPARGISGVI